MTSPIIPGLPPDTETSYCMTCRKPIYCGTFGSRGWEPDWDPDNDPRIWRHENGYAGVFGDGHFAKPGFPEIVTLCGSTKFRDQFEAEQRRLGLEGCIVLTVALFGHEEVEHCKHCSLPRNEAIHWVDLPAPSLQPHAFEPRFYFGTDEEPSAAKLALDKLHFRKIDVSHRIHVINRDGYVGLSTAREIYYAARNGKALSYLEPMDPGDLAEVLRRGEQAMFPSMVVEAQ